VGTRIDSPGTRLRASHAARTGGGAGSVYGYQSPLHGDGGPSLAGSSLSADPYGGPPARGARQKCEAFDSERSILPSTSARSSFGRPKHNQYQQCPKTGLHMDEVRSPAKDDRLATRGGATPPSRISLGGALPVERTRRSRLYRVKSHAATGTRRCASRKARAQLLLLLRPHGTGDGRSPGAAPGDRAGAAPRSSKQARAGCERCSGST